MREEIAVVYEGGVLRPLQPLALPEHTWLEVRVIRRDVDARQQVYDVLEAAGVIAALPPPEPLPVISEAELAAAAQALAAAGPLSELIIAERDGR
jgi:predicted DNA-binding antitoxin AbrB/MazE fold protein